ncbi:hypothetical protein E8E11_000701 [Didymella keratinophila]|nr:hypothetical protein E8E11_000701 [Didymella keratinophila]
MGGTEERVGSWSRPQRTQPPPSPVKGLEAIESQAINAYFKAHSEYLAEPENNAKPADATKIVPKPSSSNGPYKIGALGSAFYNIFFHGATANHGHTGASILDAERVGSKPTRPAVTGHHVPAIAKGEAVSAIANVLPEVTSTTPRDFLYIQVSTTVNDVPTAVGGYVLPMTSTVMAGQQIMVDGQATQLRIPDLLPTFLSVTISGVPTSTIAYIVSGRSVAIIGHTINLNGESTVLATPVAVFVLLPTIDINGISTTTPAYIINGSSTASIGQGVTLLGTPMVLAAPGLVPTYITTTTSGVEESGLAYIITGSMTATVGQTVTVDGSTTVLAEPTSQPGVVEGGTHRSQETCCNAVLLGFGVAFVVWL